MFSKKLLETLFFMTVFVLISACAQSRRGFIEPAAVEVWAPQELCTNEGSLEVKGCFEVTLHYTENYAEFYVIDLGILPQDASSFPYRVLGRPEGASSWHLLKSGITTTKGGVFRVDPRSDRNVWIEDYEEIIVELESGIAPDGFSYQVAAPGAGERLTRGVLDYPELYQ